MSYRAMKHRGRDPSWYGVATLREAEIWWMSPAERKRREKERAAIAKATGVKEPTPANEEPAEFASPHAEALVGEYIDRHAASIRLERLEPEREARLKRDGDYFMRHGKPRP